MTIGLLVIFLTFCCFPHFRELGIGTLSKCENELQELLKLAQTMFDSKLPPGVAMLQPFSEDSSIKKIAVQVKLLLLVSVGY